MAKNNNIPHLPALRKGVVGGSFSVRKIRLAKAEFSKRQFGIQVIDMTEYYQHLRIMTIQTWFKIGVAILYELHERP
jgi:hypothetical protein